MAKRSGRMWFVAALVGLIALAALAHVTGSGVTNALRELHGHP